MASAGRTNEQTHRPTADGDKDLVKYADIDATFYFSRTISTYADDKITLPDEEHSGYANHGIGANDVVAPGLAYPFCRRGPLGAAGLRPSVCRHFNQIKTIYLLR